MSIVVQCTGCGADFKVAERHAGKKGPCPHCKAIILIPATSTGAASKQRLGGSSLSSSTAKPISKSPPTRSSSSTPPKPSTSRPSSSRASTSRTPTSKSSTSTPASANPASSRPAPPQRSSAAEAAAKAASAANTLKRRERRPANQNPNDQQQDPNAEIRDSDIKIHEPDVFGDGPQGEKATKRTGSTRPIEREDLELKPLPIAIVAGIFLFVTAIAWLLGQLFVDSPMLSWIFLGLTFVVSIPISFAGYWVLWNREWEPVTGSSLWIRCILCGSIYTLFWLIQTFIPVEYFTGGWGWLMIAPFFIVFGTITAVATQDLEWENGLIHFGFFLSVSVFLRWLVGLSWF